MGMLAGGKRWVIGVSAVAALATGCTAVRPSRIAQSTDVAREPSDKESPVRILSRKIEYRLDELGNWQETFAQRYRILNRDGVDGWGETGTQWSPWYMGHPALNAAVTDPDGKKLVLDPKTLSESSAYPDLPAVYSDSRVVRAPLPGVRVGSVIEEAIVRKTVHPFFEGGSEFEIAFQSEVGIDDIELTLDLPKSLPLNLETFGPAPKRVDTDSGDRRRVSFHGGPYPAIKGIDYYAPSDMVPWPGVGFSTAESWHRVASAYAKLVEAKLEHADVRAMVDAATKPGASARETAARLTAELKRRVRYAAVEFGRAAILPAAPGQTLERGYGDCKDQALLLTALLRGAGLPAHLALLRTGPGSDVRARLPALDVFDHAIVQVSGVAPFWIDPTSDYARPNELPESDQGRLSLIIDSATSDLTLTPVGAAADNTYVETRTVKLPEDGAATVQETTTTTGIPEQRIRSSFDSSKEDIKKSLTDYVKRIYNAEKLGAVSYDDPSDLSRRYRVDIEAVEAGIGTGSLVSASAYTDFDVLFSHLPSSVFDEEPRTIDFVLPMVYRAEIRYVISPPAHFVADKVPTGGSVDLGPAKLVRSYEKVRDGSVKATYSFEIGQRRLTPKDVDALRRGIEHVREKPSELVEFQHEGQELIDAHKSVEAVRLFWDLVRQNPKDAIARLRLGTTLTDLGFGEEGRKQVREAVALEPDSALAQRTLAIVLERDEYGRTQHVGWDREGVIAGYRRAIELDPKNTFTKVQLALTYEYDYRGRRYRDPDQASKAVAQYDSIPKEELAKYEDGRFEQNALFALFYAHRFDELRHRLAELEPGKVPNMPALALAALDSGVMAALAEADRLGLKGEPRSTALAAASEVLFGMRHYKEAAGLMSAASSQSETAATYANRAKVMERIVAVTLDAFDTKTPEGLVKKALLLAAGADFGQVQQLLSARASDHAALDGFNQGLRNGAGAAPREVVIDVIAAALSTKKVGSDDSGFRVTATLSNPGLPEGKLEFFVVKEAGSYRIRSAEENGELGCEALYQHQQHRDKAARQWLSWARERMSGGSGDDPLRVPPFVRLWDDGRGTVELAAAALCVHGAGYRNATDVLVSSRKAPNLPASTAEAIDHACVSGYLRRNEGDKALATIRQIRQAEPKSDIALDLELSALDALHRWNDYESVARTALAHATSASAKHLLRERLAYALTQSNRIRKAREVLRQSIDEGGAPSSVYNDSAWFALFVDARDRKPDEMLNHALQAAQLMHFNEYSALHTLATVYLELGKIEEARQTLPKLLELDPELKRPTLLVIGGLAEAYGMRDVAIDAYRRLGVKKELSPTDSVLLARKRLKALESATR